MGVKYLCRCRNCGMEAETCNGTSGGFHFNCTTVWCEACGNLSDPATESQFDTSFVSPPAISCTSCNEGTLIPLDYQKCPKCTGDMQMDSMVDEDGKNKIVDRCTECAFICNVSGRPTVGQNDSVGVGMYCPNCDAVSVIEYEHKGSSDLYERWTPQELACSHCGSDEVREWTSKEPCTACAGQVAVSKHPIEFFD